MNVVREISKINEAELKLGVTGSWHDEYKDSAYVFVGGLNTELTEGDIITIMSQYGEISNINLPRHKDTGAPRGFAFIMYLDQRSTILAVDNLNGAQVLGRTLRVDHVKDYKQGREKNDEGEWIDRDEEDMNALPQATAVAEADADESEDDEDDGIDPEDPMADYLRAQKRAEKEKSKKKGKKKKHEGETKEERRARKEAKKEKKGHKGKKGKSESQGMKAVEALLAGWEGKKRGRDDSESPRQSPQPRDSRSPSPRRRRLDGPSQRRREDDSPPPRRRIDDSPPPRRRYDSPPRRRLDDTPPKERRESSRTHSTHR